MKIKSISEFFPDNKKGASGVNRAIGIVFLLLIVVALAPIIFSNTTGLGNTTILGGAPTWVYTLMVIGAAISLVKLIIPSGN